MFRTGTLRARTAEAWCSGRGHYRPERPKLGIPGRGHYRTERPRPGVPGTGQRPRPGVPGRGGHYRPRFPTRLPTGRNRRLLILLSNTPQIMWCCSGSPVLFFAVVAFVVCRQRRVIFLRGAVHDGCKGQGFKDHRAVELIVSSPDPSAHKRIGRGVRNFDSAAWEREKQNAVLSGKYARFTLNPAMNHHLLSTGNKG